MAGQFFSYKIDAANPLCAQVGEEVASLDVVLNIIVRLWYFAVAMASVAAVSSPEYGIQMKKARKEIHRHVDL